MRRTLRFITSAFLVASVLHFGGPLALVFFIWLTFIFARPARARAA